MFIGNLSFEVSTADLEELFNTYGAVESATVVTDRETGRSKGFGFVTMSDEAEAEAEAAIDAVNGTALKGRSVNVSEARPRTEPARSGPCGFSGGRSRDRW
jgi:RNA recognition motif-containing protein